MQRAVDKVHGGVAVVDVDERGRGQSGGVHDDVAGVDVDERGRGKSGGVHDDVAGELTLK